MPSPEEIKYADDLMKERINAAARYFEQLKDLELPNCLQVVGKFIFEYDDGTHLDVILSLRGPGQEPKDFLAQFGLKPEDTK